MPSDALANAKRGSARLRVALFDLDHTLLPIDSDYEWGVFTTTIGWTDPLAFARRNDEFFAQYQAGTLDIHDYVRFATDAVRRQGAQAAALAHAQFMQQVVLPALRPQALALVRSHQASDAHVVIVTATNEFVTRPIADAFGVPDLIAVELARDNGPGGTGWITDDVFVTFYSDSTNDLPLLERADAPVATNPDSRLREIASARGWRILDLFTDSQ